MGKGIHPSVDYVTFDFLHKVDNHELDNFFFHCSSMDGWVLLWEITRGVSWIVGMSQFFSECCVAFLTVVD